MDRVHPAYLLTHLREEKVQRPIFRPRYSGTDPALKQDFTRGDTTAEDDESIAILIKSKDRQIVYRF